MEIRHKRIIELEFGNSTEDLIDSNSLMDLLAEEGIDIEVDSLNDENTKIKITAYDDLLTDEMRQELDRVAQHITQSILVTDDT